MLVPKKVKFRKWQTGRSNPLTKRIRSDTRGTALSFGSYGLKAVGASRVSTNQIESCRKVMSRILKKSGRMWIRIFPDRPVTAKPPEVGMGKGKGDPQGYVFEVLPGRIIFEIDGVGRAEAVEVLRKAGAKLPLKTKFVSRDEV